VLDDRSDVASLGDEIVPGLYAAEVEYLRRYEWARTAQDILWRRSKLGLHLPANTAQQPQTWLNAHPLAR
jgi:glycerol-3-phosphate dehydrogenase